MKCRILSIGFGLVMGMTVWAAPPDPGAIERWTGLKGTMNAKEGVVKVMAPRNDLKITVDGQTGHVSK